MVMESGFFFIRSSPSMRTGPQGDDAKEPIQLLCPYLGSLVDSGEKNFRVHSRNWTLLVARENYGTMVEKANYALNLPGMQTCQPDTNTDIPAMGLQK